MADSSKHDEKVDVSADTLKNKAFDVAVDTRKFEIQLFWTRSLFFWGFIASTFAGYVILKEHGSQLSIIAACFGIVCSVSWSLVNRGSKYWQEAWETKVEVREDSVTGSLFSTLEEVQDYKNFWLRARRYSVSKIAIGLSDYTIILWFAILTWEVLRRYSLLNYRFSLKEIMTTLFVIFSFSYAILLGFCGRSSKRP